MKRCALVIHSINGNIYLMAQAFKESLERRNIDVRLYRVADEDLHLSTNSDENALEYYEDIIDLPLASAEHLRKADMIILGCPTMFGNVSSEMKAFLDSTLTLADNRELEDKLFACFTSCRYSACEGSRALDSMIYWAQNHAMLHIPFGFNMGMKGCDQPSHGLIHMSGHDGTIRPSALFGEEADLYCNNLAAYIQE